MLQGDPSVTFLYDGGMIDIATAPPPQSQQYDAVSLPFDWIVLNDQGHSQPWHDFTNLCEPPKSYDSKLENTFSFGLESGLHTSVILSLFTDSRAGRDDKLPYNTTDKRGWLGEQFLPSQTGQRGSAKGDFGSRLWINYYQVSHEDVVEAQRFAAQEALAWLIDTGVVDSIQVDAEIRKLETSDLLALHVTFYREGVDTPLYDAVWGTTLNNPEGLYATA